MTRWEVTLVVPVLLHALDVTMKSESLYNVMVYLCTVLIYSHEEKPIAIVVLIFKAWKISYTRPPNLIMACMWECCLWFAGHRCIYWMTSSLKMQHKFIARFSERVRQSLNSWENVFRLSLCVQNTCCQSSFYCLASPNQLICSSLVIPFRP